MPYPRGHARANTQRVTQNHDRQARKPHARKQDMRGKQGWSARVCRHPTQRVALSIEGSSRRIKRDSVEEIITALTTEAQGAAVGREGGTHVTPMREYTRNVAIIR